MAAEGQSFSCNPRRCKAVTASDVESALVVPAALVMEYGVFHPPKRALRFYYGPAEADWMELDLATYRGGASRHVALHSFTHLATVLCMTAGDWVAFRQRAGADPTHFNVEGWRLGPRGLWQRLEPTGPRPRTAGARIAVPTFTFQYAGGPPPPDGPPPAKRRRLHAGQNTGGAEGRRRHRREPVPTSEGEAESSGGERSRRHAAEPEEAAESDAEEEPGSSGAVESGGEDSASTADHEPSGTGGSHDDPVPAGRTVPAGTGSGTQVRRPATAQRAAASSGGGSSLDGSSGPSAAEETSASDGGCSSGEVQDGASVPDFYLVTRALGLRAGDCVLFKPRTASAHHFDVDAWRPRPDGGRQRLELVCSAVERQLARLFDPRCSKALCKADLQTVGLPCVMRREGGVFHDALEAVEPNQPLRLFYGLEELDCLEVSIYINRSTYALRSSGRLIQALGLREGDLLVFRPRPAAPGPTHFAVKAWRPGPNGRLSRLGPTEGSKQLRASRVPRSQVVVADGGAAAAPISTARGQGPPCAAADELRLSVTRTALGPSAGVGVPYSAVTSFFGVADPWAPRPEETLKLEPVAQDPRRLIKAVSLSAAKCRYGKVLWRLTGLPPWLRSIGAAVDDVLVLRRMGGGPGPSAGGSSCRYALRLELQGGDRVPGGGGAEPDAYGGTESRASAPTEPCGTERTSAGARAASAAAPVARATLAAAARDSPPRPARVETDSSVRGPSSTSQRQAAAQAAPRQGVVPGAVAPQPLPGSQAPPKRSAAEAGGVRMRATVSGGARTPAANPAGSSSSTSDSDSDDIPLAKRRRTGDAVSAPTKEPPPAPKRTTGVLLSSVPSASATRSSPHPARFASATSAAPAALPPGPDATAGRRLSDAGSVAARAPAPSPLAGWELRGVRLGRSDICSGAVSPPVAMVQPGGVLAKLAVALQGMAKLRGTVAGSSGTEAGAGGGGGPRACDVEILLERSRGPPQIRSWLTHGRLAVTTGGGFCLRGLEPLLTALKAGPGDVLLLEPVGAGASVGRAFRVELWRSGPWPPPPPPIQAVAPAAAAAPRPLFALPAGAAGTGPGGGLTSQKPLACSVVVTSKMLAGGYLRLHPAFVTDLGLAPSPPSAGAAAAAAAAPLPPAAPLTLRVVDGAEGCGTGGGLVAATLSAARGKSGGKVLWSLEGLGTWMAARGAVEGTVVRLSGPTGGQGRGEVTIALAEPTPSASAFPWGLPAPDGARF